MRNHDRIQQINGFSLDATLFGSFMEDYNSFETLSEKVVSTKDLSQNSKDKKVISYRRNIQDKRNKI